MMKGMGIVDLSEYLVVKNPKTPKANIWQLFLSCLYPITIKSDRYQGSGWTGRLLLEDIYTYRWTRCRKIRTRTIARSRYQRDENDELINAPWAEDMQDWIPPIEFKE